MGTDDLRIPTYACQGTLEHLVRDRVSKHNQKIRRPDPVFHVCAGFAEYLGFTSIFPAGIRILPFHAFVSTENHYAHDVSLIFRWLVFSNPYSFKTAVLQNGG
jgi:hypothetical protein